MEYLFNFLPVFSRWMRHHGFFHIDGGNDGWNLLKVCVMLGVGVIAGPVLTLNVCLRWVDYLRKVNSCGIMLSRHISWLYRILCIAFINVIPIVPVITHLIKMGFFGVMLSGEVKSIGWIRAVIIGDVGLVLMKIGVSGWMHKGVLI
jgi:hypothetical protein